ncbi:unnamed protein product [Brugia timori]|uniref:Uncharacterized protein n=1 Tax=Brugia timori TaxID=42155 RepID=A0A0R3QE52_9BILA|nr:unnamed protein product [Brugia timori]
MFDHRPTHGISQFMTRAPGAGDPSALHLLGGFERGAPHGMLALGDAEIEGREGIEDLEELRAALGQLIGHAVAEGLELHRGEPRVGLGRIEHRHAAALERGDGLRVVAFVVGLLRAFERGARDLLAQAFGLRRSWIDGGLRRGVAARDQKERNHQGAQQ